ncbi:MAG TPA: ComEC/Rec2 family competence protein, partial [Candidatus Limnocylindrales bacterium]|nr:ComEC/Rec2 family competence protein [Candidatus Limnocylindrales bacterium]
EPPPDDDYGSYLRRIGAVGSLRARSVEVTQPDDSGWEGLRRAAADALDRTIPAPEGGLAEGIIVGLRDRVDRDLAAAFTTAGVSHIVAISGWNIAIVATTLGALTGRLGRRRRTVATAVAIAAYVAFVGPSPSVVRAAAMAGCALFARELGRPTTALSAMGLAVAGLLILDPSYVDDAGFRLSVLATAGLIAKGTPWSKRLAGDRPGRVRQWLAESLGVSLAAQAATLPVILLDFGRLSLVSPVVNLLVAPLVAPAMAAGGVALLLGLAAGAAVGAGASVAGPSVAGAGVTAAASWPAAVLGIVATIGGLPAWVLLGLIVGVVRAAASLPLASVTIPPPSNAVAALAAAGAILALGRWRPAGKPGRGANRGGFRIALARLRGLTLGRLGPASPAPAARGRPGAGRIHAARRGRVVLVLLASSAIALGLVASHRQDGTTRLTVLDVGQGDAILLEGGRGSRLLVDGGPDPGRLMVVLDERLPPWDRRIDAVVLTHPHEDHVAGLALLLKRYQVGRVFEPGMRGPGPGYAAWDRELDAVSAPTRWTLATGDRLTVDDTGLRVLWPDPGKVPRAPGATGTDINNVSIVLLGEVEGHRFLLTGDMEEEIDPQLLARGLPTVDVLKVAHHGSATATTQPLLDALRPKVAIVSVGTGNSYGHPAPPTMARLRATTHDVYRTDLDGSVTVTFDGAATRVRTSGPRSTAALRDAVSGPIIPTELPNAAAKPIDQPGMSLKAFTAPAYPRPPAVRTQPGQARYHPADDGSVPIGGGPPPPDPRPTTLARAACTRRRRDRGLAGMADRAAARRAGRPRAGRGGRAPPRHRQGPAA